MATLHALLLERVIDILFLEHVMSLHVSFFVLTWNGEFSCVRRPQRCQGKEGMAAQMPSFCECSRCGWSTCHWRPAA